MWGDVQRLATTIDQAVISQRVRDEVGISIAYVLGVLLRDASPRQHLVALWDVAVVLQ